MPYGQTLFLLRCFSIDIDARQVKKQLKFAHWALLLIKNHYHHTHIVRWTLT